MEVINARASTLTNFEVLSFLKHQKDSIKPPKGKREKGSKHQKVNKSLLTVTLEALSWLENSPAGAQEEDHIKSFVNRLSEMCKDNKDVNGRSLQLSKEEVVQLINHRPCSAVEIQLLLDNSEERFSEDQVDKLLEIVDECLPAPPQDEEENEEDAVEQDGGEGVVDDAMSVT